MLLGLLHRRRFVLLVVGADGQVFDAGQSHCVCYRVKIGESEVCSRLKADSSTDFVTKPGLVFNRFVEGRGRGAIDLR